MDWQFDLASEIGGRREQQDRIELLALPGPRGGHLLVLADGMGGQDRGAVASQQVADTARAMLPRIVDSEPQGFLTELCVNAHESIRAIGRRYGTNPASTCTALYLTEEEAYWVHVGDSRLCQFNAGELVTRTTDHTLATLTGSGADTGDHRLYMCLGGRNEVEPEFGASAVGADDWFLLGTDGFWNQFEDTELAGLLKASGNGRKGAAELAQIAVSRGGENCDNVSLALVSHMPEKKKAWWRL